MSSQLASALANQIAPRIDQMMTSLVQDESDMWNFVQQATPTGANRPGVGKRMEWQVNTASTVTTEAHAEDASDPVAGSQTWVPAFLSWANYWNKIQYTRSSILQCGDSVSLIGNLLQQELSKQMRDMARKLDADLAVGGGSNQFVGLTTAINDTGTYANLDRATYLAWASDDTAIGGAYTLAAIRATLADRAAPTNGPGAHLTDALCGPTVFNIIGALVGSTVEHTITQGEAGSDTPLAVKGGPEVVRYKGVRFHEIRRYVAQRVDYIDRGHLMFETLENFNLSEPKEVGDSIATKLRFKAAFGYRNTGHAAVDQGITS